jgi:hypothetical protein
MKFTPILKVEVANLEINLPPPPSKEMSLAAALIGHALLSSANKKTIVLGEFHLLVTIDIFNFFKRW